MSSWSVFIRFQLSSKMNIMAKDRIFPKEIHSFTDGLIYRLDEKIREQELKVQVCSKISATLSKSEHHLQSVSFHF